MCAGNIKFLDSLTSLPVLVRLEVSVNGFFVLSFDCVEKVCLRKTLRQQKSVVRTSGSFGGPHVL